MVLSSRDRKFVSVEIVWLGQSPGHRRLRFSFQFNDVKDRDCLSAAPLFSAGGRRRRLSSGRPLSCQSVLSDFLRPLVTQEFGRKNRHGPPRGFPHGVRSDSTEARENTQFET
jgi:hypothetical protein